MVLISSQVYRGSPNTEHNQIYSQHPAPWTSTNTDSPMTLPWPQKKKLCCIILDFCPRGSSEVVSFNWILQNELSLLTFFLEFLYRNQTAWFVQREIWMDFSKNWQANGLTEDKKPPNSSRLMSDFKQSFPTSLLTRHGAQLPSNKTSSATVEAATSGSLCRHLLGSN